MWSSRESTATFIAGRRSSKVRGRQIMWIFSQATCPANTIPPIPQGSILSRLLQNLTPPGRLLNPIRMWPMWWIPVMMLGSARRPLNWDRLLWSKVRGTWPEVKHYHSSLTQHGLTRSSEMIAAWRTPTTACSESVDGRLLLFDTEAGNSPSCRSCTALFGKGYLGPFPEGHTDL